MALRAPAPFSVGDSCPLCGGRAQVSEGTAEAHLSLLSCSRCRAFVIEKRLVEVITNAREWNLLPVLRYLAYLSRAAQSAALQGTVLLITSTNWIRLALGQQHLQEQSARSIDLAYVLREADVQAAGAGGSRRT
jgi:hypothetical protein